MSVTERIIETVERGSYLGFYDDEVDKMLYAIGCTRVIHIAENLIVYYVDAGEEHFIVISISAFGPQP
jgi:hypothetical protein